MRDEEWYNRNPVIFGEVGMEGPTNTRVGRQPSVSLVIVKGSWVKV